MRLEKRPVLTHAQTNARPGGPIGALVGPPLCWHCRRHPMLEDAHLGRWPTARPRGECVGISYEGVPFPPERTARRRRPGWICKKRRLGRYRFSMLNPAATRPPTHPPHSHRPDRGRPPWYSVPFTATTLTPGQSVLGGCIAPLGACEASGATGTLRRPAARGRPGRGIWSKVAGGTRIVRQ